MKKPVVGVTRPLTAEGIGNLWQARQFFTYSGLGRQANPAIHATLVEPQHVAAADDPASPRSTGIQPQAGFESVTLLLEGVIAERALHGGADVDDAAVARVQHDDQAGRITERRCYVRFPVHRHSTWPALVQYSDGHSPRQRPADDALTGP